MARKHDEYDNQEGLKPDVKNKITKGNRAAARQEKTTNAQGKTWGKVGKTR